MPVFTFACRSCGHRFDELATAGEAVRCACGASAERQFTPSPHLVMPEFMKGRQENGRAKNRAYLNSPKTREKLDAGIYTIEGTRNRWDASD